MLNWLSSGLGWVELFCASHFGTQGYCDTRTMGITQTLISKLLCFGNLIFLVTEFKTCVLGLLWIVLFKNNVDRSFLSLVSLF